MQAGNINEGGTTRREMGTRSIVYDNSMQKNKKLLAIMTETIGVLSPRGSELTPSLAIDRRVRLETTDIVGEDGKGKSVEERIKGLKETKRSDGIEEIATTFLERQRRQIRQDVLVPLATESNVRVVRTSRERRRRRGGSRNRGRGRDRNSRGDKRKEGGRRGDGRKEGKGKGRGKRSMDGRKGRKRGRGEDRSRNRMRQGRHRRGQRNTKGGRRGNRRDGRRERQGGGTRSRNGIGRRWRMEGDNSRRGTRKDKGRTRSKAVNDGERVVDGQGGTERRIAPTDGI